MQIPEQSGRPPVLGNDSPRTDPLLSAAPQGAKIRICVYQQTGEQSQPCRRGGDVHPGGTAPAFKSFLGLRGGAHTTAKGRGLRHTASPKGDRSIMC